MLEALRELEKEIKGKRAYKRFLCIWLKESENKTAKEIAGQVGYHWRHVQRIQADVKEKGLEAIYPSFKGGNRQLLTDEEELEVLNAHQGCTTAQPIIEAISQKVGRPVISQTVYALLERHGWKAKRPRPQHPKADAKEQTLFKKTGGNAEVYYPKM